MKLVILDRDGVINENPEGYVTTPDEWRPIPGSLEAIAKLHQGDWHVVVASNQSAIGRGLITLEDLSKIHRKMDRALEELGGRIDGLFFCPHAPDAGCNCRKPKPGLLEDITRRLHAELGGVPFIGDTQKDVDAARAAGAQAMLVRTGKGEATSKTAGFPKDVPVFKNLAEAADSLLAEAQ